MGKIVMVIVVAAAVSGCIMPPPHWGRGPGQYYDAPAPQGGPGPGFAPSRGPGPGYRGW